jgi:hypothetical protein
LQVERLYGWHLLDSIPLLSVARRLRLDEPKIFADHVSGSLLLSFKLLVLVPLVGFVVSGYRVADRELAKGRQAKARQKKKRAPYGRNWDEEIWPVMLVVGSAVVGTALIVWGALNPASPLRGLIDDVVPSQAAVEGITGQLGWVDAWIPPILGAGLLCAGLAAAADQLTYYAPEPPGTRASTVGWAAAVGAGLLLATALVVGITVLLIRTGVSRPSKGVGDTQGLGQRWRSLSGTSSTRSPGSAFPRRSTGNWRTISTTSGAALCSSPTRRSSCSR